MAVRSSGCAPATSCGVVWKYAVTRDTDSTPLSRTNEASARTLTMMDLHKDND